MDDLLKLLWSPKEAEFLGRLALSAFLGGAIGLERERTHQAAGLRTHMIVALGSTLMMIVSIKMGELYEGDRGRIAAQVVSGIGFLGAGAIMRYGASIKGLTTAACLWTSSGIGLAVGMGYYTGAVGATLLTLMATFLFGKIERIFQFSKSVKRIIVTAKDAPNVLGAIEAILNKVGIAIRELGIEKDIANHRQVFEISMSCPPSTDLQYVVREIGTLPDIEKIDLD